MEEKQTSKNTRRIIESMLDEIDEEELSLDEYCEGVKKGIRPWGRQAERIMDFHLILLEDILSLPLR